MEPGRVPCHLALHRALLPRVVEQECLMPDEIPEFRPFIFSCSGSADVGGIADGAARSLSESGVAKMYCLAGIGARVEQIVNNAALAERLISVDGCENACS